MSKRWRCLHCNAPIGYEFIADGPSCPSCKRQGDPLILPLVDVHWLEPNPAGLIPGVEGPLSLPCMPSRPSVMGLAATGELLATTCPKCRATESFQRAWGEWAAVWPDLAQKWQERQTLIV